MTEESKMVAFWKDDYKVGDEVAIELPGCDEANPFRGEIVAVLELPGWLFRNYVVAIETEMDPLLEVRNGAKICLWHDPIHEQSVTKHTLEESNNPILNSDKEH